MIKVFGVQNSLSVVLCKDVDDAAAKGFEYKQPEFKAVEVEQVVVVRNGTEQGNSTVDLILKDQNGQKYVVMLTGRLLKSIPC